MTSETRTGSLGTDVAGATRGAGQQSGSRPPWSATLTRGILERIRTGVVAARPSVPVRYGLATLAVVAVALARFALFAEFAPWFLFTPAVVVVALFLGGGAGLWATLLSTLCAGYVLLDVPPVGYLSLVQWVASAIFALTTTGLVGLVVALRSALREADAARADLGRSVAAAAEREAFLSSVMASSTDCIEVLDLDGRLTFMSEGGRRVMEVGDFDAVAGRPWPDFRSGIGHPEAKEAVAAAREGRSGDFTEQATTMEGTPRWWHVAVSPIRGLDGRPARILAVSRDVSALHESERDLRLMNGELAHRLKNVLTVVQSITRQTLRSAADMPTAERDLSARLVALGAATDVLTSASWRSADLRELTKRALAPHGQLGERILLDGPDITLQPQVAVALVLALHELATNAAKYGALSNDTGTVTVEWRVDGAGPDGRFRLQWQERGGPSVSEPTRRGFGSTLIERSLRSYFGGTAASEFHPDGLAFAMDARMGDTALTDGKA